jgi:hypothetical protein
MIIRWAVALAVAVAFAGTAEAKGERPRRIETFPAYLYLLPPVTCLFPALREPAEH